MLYRASVSSFREQASHITNVPFVKVPYKLCQQFRNGMIPTVPVEIMYHYSEEEIAFKPSCWLWDYLCRSRASGFLPPLSGDADSSSVAAIVSCMCQLVIQGQGRMLWRVASSSLKLSQLEMAHGWVLQPLLMVPLMICFLQEMSICYVAMVGTALQFSRNKNWHSLDHIGRHVTSVTIMFCSICVTILTLINVFIYIDA